MTRKEIAILLNVSKGAIAVKIRKDFPHLKGYPTIDAMTLKKLAYYYGYESTQNRTLNAKRFYKDFKLEEYERITRSALADELDIKISMLRYRSNVLFPESSKNKMLTKMEADTLRKYYDKGNDIYMFFMERVKPR